MTEKNKTSITAEAGKQELFIVREFDASSELVFRAFTDPQMLEKWLGPESRIEVDYMKSESGGSYRYFHKNPFNGQKYGFFGEFHEVTPPERIVRTFEFDGLPERGHVILETLLFESLPGGRTKTTTHMVFRSVSDRDGMVMSGMESGVTASYSQLDDLLSTEN